LVYRSPPFSEIEGFDTVQIFHSSVLPVDSRVDAHRLARRVSTDVPQNVLFRTLISHQRREHSAVGVWREFLVEPVLTTFHHTCPDSRILHSPLRLCLRDAIPAKREVRELFEEVDVVYLRRRALLLPLSLQLCFQLFDP